MIWRVIGRLFLMGLLFALIGAGGVGFLVWHYTRDLPDHSQLLNYQPAIATRVYADDGKLLAEYAEERRIFVPADAIPPLVKQAFISAEDQNFYRHIGIDPLSIVRALVTDVKDLSQNRRPVGASTITQQVAKNFLLTNEVSIARKVKEIALALRIEKTLTKEQILELYLNEIYLGGGSYGVAAAALNYFNKPLDALTIAEAAYLGALPKAPSNYNPATNYDRAKQRRDWVIDRMQEDGAITADQAEQAKAEPITLRRRDPDTYVRADYFAEEVRRTLLERYSQQRLYRAGLMVRTSLDPTLQTIADRVFRDGLVTYDRRHGWRGALATGPVGDLAQRLAKFTPPAGTEQWALAGVTKVDDKGAEITLKAGGTGHIPFAALAWAHPTLPEQHVGPAPRRTADVLQPGDIILVAPQPGGAQDSYELEQVPDVSGGMVVLDPHTGRVKALVGGWSYDQTQFDRATQASRQPGSSFKPFVYMAALDNGFTPSTIVLDTPIALDVGPNQPKWRPANYEGKFFGPMPLRFGIEDSRNLMTVRVALEIGMPKVVEYARKFGVVDHLEPVLAMSLGAGETTALRMATAYGMIVNGGKRITPSLIDRVQDSRGHTIYKHDDRLCAGCNPPLWDHQPPPVIPDDREQIEDPATCYQMLNMMEGVVQRGTAKIVSTLKRPLAGKTGTTNDFTDAWFVGVSPDLVVATYVGFDQPRTLGPKETGGRVSAPIFKDFIEAALGDSPAVPFRIPPGVDLVRVDPQTGLLASADDPKALLVPFKPGTEPGSEPAPGRASAIDNLNTGTPVDPSAGEDAPQAGIGGLY